MQDEELISIFNEEVDGLNSVAGVRVIRDQKTNLGKGFAYILFNTQASARMALAKDGTLLRKRPLRVTYVSSASAKGNAGKPGKQSSLGRIKATGAVGEIFL